MNKSKKTKITNSEKLKTMIVSVIIAIAIWLVAVYVDDPSINVTAKNVAVKLFNEEALAEQGLVVKNKEEFPTFNVRVSGKRSNLMNYMNRITVDFDLGNIKQVGEYELVGTVSLPNTTISLAKKTNFKMTVKVAPIGEKSVKLYAMHTGTNKDYIIKSVPVETEVFISGASDEVARVSSAAVEVNVSNATSDFDSSGEIFFCDADGKKLTDVSSVSAEQRIVKVQNYIYQKISLPVKIKLSEDLKQEYVLDSESVVASPSEIEVGVLPGTDIEAVYVQINKISEKAEVYRAFTEEEGVYIPYANSEVTVTAPLNKIEEKNMELEVKSINLPTGTRAEFDAKITLNVKCADITQPQDLTATVDMKNATIGENSIKVKIEGNMVCSYEDKYINVKLVQG